MDQLSAGDAWLFPIVSVSDRRSRAEGLETDRIRCAAGAVWDREVPGRGVDQQGAGVVFCGGWRRQRVERE